MIGTILTVLISFSAIYALHTYCRKTGVFYKPEKAKKVHKNRNPRTDGNR